MRISDWSSDVCSSDLVLPRLQGAFALAIMFRGYPDMLIGARLGAPLVVGYGADENYLGSDALALAPLTQKIAYLEEGDWAVVTRGSVTIFDRDNQPVERPVTQSGVSGAMIDKGNHRHFMQDRKSTRLKHSHTYEP